MSVESYINTFVVQPQAERPIYSCQNVNSYETWTLLQHLTSCPSNIGFYGINTFPWTVSVIQMLYESAGISYITLIGLYMVKLLT